MKHLFNLLIIYLLLLTKVCLADLSEMDDDQLLRGLHGHRVEGYSAELLEAELKGERAGALVERCKNNVGLRKMLVVFPRDIADSRLKEDLIIYILSEDSIWDDAQKLSEALIMRANAFAYPALAGEFALTEEPADSSLALCLLTPKGRGILLDFYKKLLRLESSDRNAENEKMVDLTNSLREAIAIYGTDEYLRGGSDKEDRPRRPIDRRTVLEEKSNGTDGVGRSGGAPDSGLSSVKRQMLFGVGICFAIVLSVVAIKKRFF